MKYAIIENNIVTNIAKSESALADNWIASETAAIGDSYENGEFIKPPASPTPIPAVVSRFQARAALYQAGLLDTVEAIMDLPETDMMAKIAWADAQEFKRTSPTIAAMAAVIGFTEAQLDDLFISAATLDA